MSTTPPLPAWSVQLIDDAAVFPPGLRPVDQAWRDHQQLRSGAYAECVGPLLLPPSHAAGLSRIAAAEPPRQPPLRVAVIGRADTLLADLATAVQTLATVAGVLTDGLEVSHATGWTAALQYALPLAVEVSRAAGERDRALDEIAGARADGHPVIAKLRTQATATASVPTAAELAGFIIACRQRDLPFKLTGGLHHAVATVGDDDHRQDGRPEHEHGVLNVLLATHAARVGDSTADTEHILARTDSQALAENLLTLTDEQQRDLRADFTSYGCCDVLDPLTELAALGLLSLPNPDEEPV